VAAATTVRTDVVARLIAAATSAGSRVHDSRLHAIQAGLQAGGVTPDTTPLLTVETNTIRREGRGHGKGHRTETIELEIRGIIAPAPSTTDAELAAALDTLEEDVADALLEDGEWIAQYRPGRGEGVVIKPTERVLDISEAGSRYGSFRQVYEITQTRTRQAPAGERDALETVTVDVQQNNDTVAEVTLADLEA
jgi:hypothetical protein